MSPDPEAPRSEGGLFGSLRRFGQSLLDALQTRLEILSTDIAVARASLIQLVLLALGVLFCFQVGVFLAVLFLVLLAGSEHRMMVIGITSGLLLLRLVVANLPKIQLRRKTVYRAIHQVNGTLVVPAI